MASAIDPAAVSAVSPGRPRVTFRLLTLGLADDPVTVSDTS